jgi:hypothetical protein
MLNAKPYACIVGSSSFLILDLEDCLEVAIDSDTLQSNLDSRLYSPESSMLTRHKFKSPQISS